MDSKILIRRYLITTSAAVLLIGLVFLLLPVQTVKFFSDAQIGNVRVFVMFLGSSLIGYSFLNFSAASESNLASLTPVIWGNMMALAIAIPVSSYALASGYLNGRGYLILAIHLVFFSGFYYCLRLISRA